MVPPDRSRLTRPGQSKALPLSAAALVVAALMTVIGLAINLSSTLLIMIVLVLLALAVFVAVSVFGSAGSSDRVKSNTDESGRRTISFENDNVTVVVPQQRIGIDAAKLPLLPPDKMQSPHDEFTPHRIVINLELVEENNPGKVVTEFNPPFELRVGYTAADIQHAQAMKQTARQTDLKYGATEAAALLQVGFWDGCRWIRFTEQKHNLHFHPNDLPATGGVAIVTLSQWVDPHVGVGP